MTGSSERAALCVGKAEVGATRGECVLSEQNNGWLPKHSTEKAPAFFFFFFFSAVPFNKHPVVQEHSGQSSYSNTRGNAFGSD